MHEIQSGPLPMSDNQRVIILRCSRRLGIGAGGVGAPNSRSKNEGPEEYEGPE